ncbi:hypothetical protein C6P97_07670 [Burkholderia multivorans]|uniref:Uncharacterized protein n=1 Tax=Burkholderia multivorans TaxID=87883 RepID=A0AB37ASV8_9BURK|nr:hypothetical protein C6P99_19455 [Burkholderia multivorans]PRE52224.1 hypothetical protein C6P97_07670 [Burkholderia multivorans]
MPVQPETEPTDDPRNIGKTRRQTLASALAQRERPSAFIGSRILAGPYELEVVDIGPFTDHGGDVVTFLARPTGPAGPRAGAMLKTAWGTCRVVD